MSFIEHTTVSGIRCDRKGCDKAIHIPATSNIFEARRYLERLAASHDWTFWVGRNRKAFCQDHGPSRGTKMRPAEVLP